MDETELNEAIRRTLAESRRPPEPPLDEMWANIEQRAFDTVPVVRIRPWQASRWHVPAIAAAALCIGVGLGRYVAPQRVVVRTVAATSVPAATKVASVPPRTVPDSSPAPAALPPVAHTYAVNTPSHATQGRQPDAATIRFVSQLDVGARGDMARYLAQTAALLAALPSGHGTAASDSVIAVHAGELLTQTHLLLDSQAGSDPTLHRLLEDLELVLAQVARLRATRGGTDLQLIHQALTTHDVLPRVYDATVEVGATD
jgi:hypothetical protein